MYVRNGHLVHTLTLHTILLVTNVLQAKAWNWKDEYW
jgi:hypothetical protein